MQCELRRLEGLLKLLKAEYRKTTYYSNAHLEAREHKDRKYYTLVRQISGKRVRKYCGTEGPAISKVKIRRFLEAEMMRVSANVENLRNALSAYYDIDPYKVSLELPRAYRELPDICYELMGYERPVLRSDTRGKPSHNETKCHITRRGERVRSKNEVIIEMNLILGIFLMLMKR